MNNKILVVDDESRIRKIIRDFLVREGYVVCEAEDGEAALDIFCSNNDIDLIIMDVMMPKMDGYTLIKEISTWRWCCRVSARWVVSPLMVVL